VDRQTDTDAGRWMSYTELADSRGISKKAAQRLTLRHRWRRQPANDGGVLVWVPEGAAAPGRQTGRQSGALTDRHEGGSDGPDVTLLLEGANKRADAALALADQTLAQLGEATERIQRAEDRADAAQQRADRAEARADAAEKAAEQARTEVQDAHAAAEALRAAHAADLAAAHAAARLAEEQADALRQAEAARQARGRLRRTWDGWRGR
jgi:Xaa-Pro aminopeptidase